jgi:hypothetical protein
MKIASLLCENNLVVIRMTIQSCVNYVWIYYLLKLAYVWWKVYYSLVECTSFHIMLMWRFIYKFFHHSYSWAFAHMFPSNSCIHSLKSDISETKTDEPPPKTSVLEESTEAPGKQLSMFNFLSFAHYLICYGLYYGLHMVMFCISMEAPYSFIYFPWLVELTTLKSC